MASGLAKRRKMNVDEFCDAYACTNFPRGAFWMVVCDDVTDIDTLQTAKVFRTKQLANEYVKRIANGNINWRVLEVARSRRVVSTWPIERSHA